LVDENIIAWPKEKSNQRVRIILPLIKLWSLASVLGAIIAEIMRLAIAQPDPKKLGSATLTKSDRLRLVARLSKIGNRHPALVPKLRQLGTVHEGKSLATILLEILSTNVLHCVPHFLISRL
jgi:hypothetical protein